MTGRGKNGLSPEDASLWDAVRRTIRPLRPTEGEGESSKSSDRQPARKRARLAKPGTALSPPAQGLRGSPAPQSIDRKEWRRIAAGRLAIGRRLDLHGMDRQSAHMSVNQTLLQARDAGIRVVLIVTGKGTARSAAEDKGRGESGVLKRELPHWLRTGSLRAVVRAFGEAHPRHGGAGATYVLLRQKKT